MHDEEDGFTSALPDRGQSALFAEDNATVYTQVMEQALRSATFYEMGELRV